MVTYRETQVSLQVNMFGNFFYRFEYTKKVETLHIYN